jgi:hypothetical protein
MKEKKGRIAGLGHAANPTRSSMVENPTRSPVKPNPLSLFCFLDFLLIILEMYSVN